MLGTALALVQYNYRGTAGCRVSISATCISLSSSEWKQCAFSEQGTARGLHVAWMLSFEFRERETLQRDP